MRDEQKRINSYRENKQIEFFIRMYKNNESFKKVLSGNVLEDFNKYVDQVECNIPKDTLEKLDIFNVNNPTLAKRLGVHKDKIRKQKESIRQQFKPIIEANRSHLELFI